MTKIAYDITMLNKDHLLNSCTWRHQWDTPVRYANHSTAQL